MSEHSFGCPGCKALGLFKGTEPYSAGAKDTCKKCGKEVVLKDDDAGIWAELVDQPCGFCHMTGRHELSCPNRIEDDSDG